MTQEFQNFTPDTVDEQIEHISSIAPANTESSDGISREHIVHHLRHMYQSEQRDIALARGWQRIVQASNSTSIQDSLHLEHNQMNEDGQHPLPIHAGFATSGPGSPQQKSNTSKGRRHIAAFAQPLAAVMLVSVVLASFLAFVVYRTGTPGAKNQDPRSGTIHSIVATVAEDGTVYALQPDSNQILWTFSKATQKRRDLTSAVVVQGRVVYTVIGLQMYALSAIDGTLLWQQRLASPNPALPDYVQNFFRTLISDNNILYVSGITYAGKDQIHALPSSHISAIRADDGKILWNYQGTTTDSLLAASNKNVYIRSGASLLVLHGDTGELNWMKPSITPQAIVTDDTTTYVQSSASNSFDTKLLALNTQDGHMRWATSKLTASGGFVLYQGMIILSFLDYPPSTHHFCAYKTSDGTSIWCSPKTAAPSLETFSYTPMNITSYDCFSSEKGTYIEARNVRDGKLLWSTPSRISKLVNSIIDLNGVIYTLNGDITAFDDKNGHELWQFSKRNQAEVMKTFAVGSW